jgi:hypothetical protein
MGTLSRSKQVRAAAPSPLWRRGTRCALLHTAQPARWPLRPARVDGRAAAGGVRRLSRARASRAAAIVPHAAFAARAALRCLITSGTPPCASVHGGLNAPHVAEAHVTLSALACATPRAPSASCGRRRGVKKPIRAHAAYQPRKSRPEARCCCRAPPGVILCCSVVRQRRLCARQEALVAWCAGGRC